MIAILGAIALAFVSQAKAESGEGNGFPPPAEAEIEASQNAVSAEAEASQTGDKNPAKKPLKASAKASGEQSAKPSAPVREQTSAEAAAPATATEAASAEAEQKDLPNIEVTSAILPGQTDARFRLKPVDITRADTIRPMIARHASENGVPFELADAVVRLESRYNPVARNGVNVGLTQINVRTAQSLGYQGGAAGLLDAETNLRYGVKYLALAYKLARGDTCGTILRYQLGHRAEAMTRSSRTYCSKVKTLIAASN